MINFSQIRPQLNNVLKGYYELISLKAQDQVAKYGAHSAYHATMFGLICMVLMFLYTSLALLIGQNLQNYALGFLIAASIIVVKAVLFYVYRNPFIRLLKKMYIGSNYEPASSNEQTGSVSNSDRFYEDLKQAEINVLRQEHNLESALGLNSPVFSSDGNHSNTSNLGLLFQGKEIVSHGISIYNAAKRLVDSLSSKHQ